MNQKGALETLFDFSFSEFITTRIIKLFLLLVFLGQPWELCSSLLQVFRIKYLWEYCFC